MTMSSVAAPPNSDAASPSPEPEGRKQRQWLSRKRLSVGVAAVLVLLGVGAGAAWLAGGSATSSAAGAPVVTTSSENVKVDTGTMTQSISASGTLEPANDSDLTFDVSGVVTAVDVIVGQKVKYGQTLATIDPTALADQVAADKSALASDEDELTTDEDDDALSSTIDSQKAQVTSAESQLASARSDLADAALKATFSGTVASVDLAVGDTVTTGGGSSTASTSSAAISSTSAGSTSSGSSDGITVISTHAYTISTSVDDTEVGEVKAGDAATILPSGSSTSLDGKVVSVSLIASTSSDSDVASFPVVIDVTGSPSGIYPGASATVSIIVKDLKNVVEVPTAAISYSGGQATVTEISAGSQKTVDVRTGTSLNGETQITRGLQAGDSIVEEVTRFKTASGASRTLLGGAGRTGSGAGPGGAAGGFSGTGGPPAGGEGGAAPSGGGSALFGSGS
jgi:macrolide-specific efflux system membrane fusion protein